MTTTASVLEHPTTEHTERRKVSDAYLGCRDDEQVAARYREIYAAAQAEHGGKYKVPLAVQVALGEDYRLAYVAVRGSGVTNTGPKRGPGQAVAAVTDDGTITCAGACGETLPEKKFPTLKAVQNPDGTLTVPRGSVCRDCARAALEARKAGA